MTASAAAPAWTAFERHARLFHALSDPRRLRIIDLLRGGERCVCDLQADLACAQSLLSFHLKALRDAGLVTARKDGRWIYYALALGGLHHVEEVASTLGRPKSALRRLPIRCCG